MNTINKNYRPDIDGIRGISIFCVVMYHIGAPFFHGGFVGVDMFFVISGYLICGIISREVREQRFSFASFYLRRAKRILPALFVALIIAFIVCYAILDVAEMNDFVRSAVSNLLGVSNIYFWKTSDYFSAAAEYKPLMMTWSLSVEEQFYVFFPIVLLLIRRFKWPLKSVLWTLIVLSLAASIVLTLKRPTIAFFLLPARAWELGLGAMLAVYEYDRRPDGWQSRMGGMNLLSATGLVLILIAVFCYTPQTAFPGIAALLPVVGVVMCIAANGSFINRHVLSLRPLVFIGLVSYSWYLWHWLVLSFLRLTTDHVPSLFWTGSAALVSFVIAILSWRFVETPFRSKTAPEAIPQTLKKYGYALLIMIIAGLVGVRGHGLASRLPADYVALEAKSERRPDPCMSGYGEAILNTSPECVAEIAERPTVAIIGDSHAGALAPGLRKIANTANWGFVQYTKSSCPNLLGVSRLAPNHPTLYAECKQYNEQAFARILNDSSVKMVVLAGFWAAPFDEEKSGQRYKSTQLANEQDSPAQSREDLHTGLLATVAALTGKGKQVVLVKDVPVFNFDPVRAVASAMIPARHVLSSFVDGTTSLNGRSVPRSQLISSFALVDTYFADVKSHFPETVIVDPWKSLCNSVECDFRNDAGLLYFDSQHLSREGADIAVRAIVLQP